MTDDDSEEHRIPRAGASDRLLAVRQIEAEELFDGRKQVVITHNQDRYVLRITRHGKLILNK